jgi:hypothetical protein
MGSSEHRNEPFSTIYATVRFSRTVLYGNSYVLIYLVKFKLNLSEFVKHVEGLYIYVLLHDSSPGSDLYLEKCRLTHRSMLVATI